MTYNTGTPTTNYSIPTMAPTDVPDLGATTNGLTAILAAIDTAMKGVAWSGSGKELGYDQITSNVSITGTGSGSPTSVITCAAHTFDGSPVLLHVFSPELYVKQTSNFGVALWESGSAIAEIGQAGNTGNSDVGVTPFSVFFRFTPSAGSHTYTIYAWDTVTGGTFCAGTGTSGALTPAFARFTKV